MEVPLLNFPALYAILRTGAEVMNFRLRCFGRMESVDSDDIDKNKRIIVIIMNGASPGICCAL